MNEVVWLKGTVGRERGDLSLKERLSKERNHELVPERPSAAVSEKPRSLGLSRGGVRSGRMGEGGVGV